MFLVLQVLSLIYFSLPLPLCLQSLLAPSELSSLGSLEVSEQKASVLSVASAPEPFPVSSPASKTSKDEPSQFPISQVLRKTEDMKSTLGLSTPFANSISTSATPNHIYSPTDITSVSIKPSRLPRLQSLQQLRPNPRRSGWLLQA